MVIIASKKLTERKGPVCPRGWPKKKKKYFKMTKQKDMHIYGSKTADHTHCG